MYRSYSTIFTNLYVDKLRYRYRTLKHNKLLAGNNNSCIGAISRTSTKHSQIFLQPFQIKNTLKYSAIVYIIVYVAKHEKDLRPNSIFTTLVAPIDNRDNYHLLNGYSKFSRFQLFASKRFVVQTIEKLQVREVEGPSRQ